MPTIWNSIYIRDDFDDQGAIPSGRSASHSPDIIPVGTNPIPNYLQTLQETWNQDIGQDIIQDANNYLYLRGKNLSTLGQGGMFTMYYAQMSTALNPANWTGNKIPGADNSPAVAVLNTAPGDIALPSEAFFWKDVPPPPANSHYCLIATYSNPPTVPDPVPSTPFPTIDAFIQWVLNSPNVAWRNIVVLPGDTATNTTATNISNMDTRNPREYMFYASCYNMPVGTSLVLTCQAAGADPVIYANGTVVQYVNPATLACLTTLPVSWGPYPLQLVATAPPGQSLAGAQVIFQQILIESDLTADYIRHLMEPLPKHVHEAAGLSQQTLGVLVGECELFFTEDDGTVRPSVRGKGMFA